MKSDCVDKRLKSIYLNCIIILNAKRMNHKSLNDLIYDEHDLEEVLNEAVIRLYFGKHDEEPRVRRLEAEMKAIEEELTGRLFYTLSMRQLLNELQQAEVHMHAIAAERIAKSITNRIERHVSDIEDLANGDNAQVGGDLRQMAQDFAATQTQAYKGERRLNNHYHNWRDRVAAADVELQHMLYKQQREFNLAAMMATHARLGSGSKLATIDPLLLKREILDHI